MSEEIELTVIDDDKEFCELMEEFFSSHSKFSLAGIANQAEDGLKLIEEKQPDALILDLVMPGQDGVEVLKKLKQDKINPEMKIIVLTAFGQEKIIKQVSELGADYYIMKPFDLDKLAERITRLFASEDEKSLPGEIDLEGSEKEKEQHIEVRISKVLHKLGIPAHIKGYLYLREAIKLVFEDINMMGAVTKKLYPTVAENFDTTPSRVERAIRHAIDVAWDKGEQKVIRNYFGNTLTSSSGKPTNSQFIAKIADRLRLELK